MEKGGLQPATGAGTETASRQRDRVCSSGPSRGTESVLMAMWQYTQELNLEMLLKIEITGSAQCKNGTVGSPFSVNT